MDSESAGDLPVFDRARTAANDNFQIELGAVIPQSKVAAREELALIFASGVAITHCKYQPPRTPGGYKPKGPKADNDDVAPLPIIEALRRDDRQADVSLVMRYRSLVEVVGASPYDAELDMSEEGVGVAARSLRLSGKSFEASFIKMSATSLPGGEVSYREERRTVKQRLSTGQRTAAASDGDDARSQVPMHIARSEDQRIARIDGIPVLATLRTALADLVTPFEDAVLGGASLTEIGDSLGFKWKARSAEAKWRIYAALDMLRDEWRLLDRRMEAAAAACERRVEARRCELAARRTAFLRAAA